MDEALEAAMRRCTGPKPSSAQLQYQQPVIVWAFLLGFFGDSLDFFEQLLAANFQGSRYERSGPNVYAVRGSLGERTRGSPENWSGQT